ncbi:ATP-dependent RNA helicase dbp9 [Taphrina deformans PYCC 5710]|uniref:RNA helicase n=1 Tax=Taphrina deformans (strain PYCC 5710 / ATCC 11124 / CBS 356.35 / IMI 108563 / JCM 9778 / NBRC 8474) TaxID=1097556 RepID=R4X7H5_TAPDE|nr:ATP-dependent RNA helicase dbp9 [Taphrina deformans PYCC 5710]|eukprot:CCG81340.1 ATP-dependent RNA helicase dbp9 [Taphrina deformans PYCC 5710]
MSDSEDDMVMLGEENDALDVSENEVQLDDIPTGDSAQHDTEIVISEEETAIKFEDFDLDPRLQRAIAKLHFSVPTPVQAQSIPLIRDGKDLLARAKTGSGKTAAYLVPILQAFLAEESLAATTQALILVPTKELSEQVNKTIEKLCQYSQKTIKHLNLANSTSEAAQKPLLLDGPHIVISTPSRALAHMNGGNLDPDNLRFFVIDEADLVLSYGYDEDVASLAKVLPRSVQTIMMSATLDSSVENLKSTLCRNPVILKLTEAEVTSNPLIQYYVNCAEEEKFLLSYVILKLKLIKGKIIIFVNNIDRCYRLKLFLEQFGIKSCVLNSELPINSRGHIVEEFNKGVYDIIIAADDSEVMGGTTESDDEYASIKPKKEEDDGEEKTSTRKRKRATTRMDKEFGVSRGVDFRNVACVLNFDLPTTTRSYVHRVGRTARAGRSGMAMSFVIPSDKFGKHRATTLETSKKDEKVLARIFKDQEARGNEIKAYNFNMTQVEAFRYRMEDGLRSVTKSSIRDARAKEIRAEIMASEKLKGYFEERPEELAALRHDAELHAKRVQSHLKHVPDYLMPKSTAAVASKDVGFVGFKGTTQNRIRKNRAANRAKGVGKKDKGNKRSKKSDPLKTFK